MMPLVDVSETFVRGKSCKEKLGAHVIVVGLFVASDTEDARWLGADL